ncbi:MAG: hypothetical protein H6741_27790 [Alphaproteobacteria bacterium]|nr:hypothetical protein [Alphaproteobacteria bacterium]
MQRLTTHPPRPDVKDKRTLPAFSPTRLTEGATRGNDAVLEVSCLVFDLDEPGQVESLLPWTGCLWVEHSTWSHTPEAPKLRWVIPLARPIPVADWARAWTWAARHVPGADRVCKDASRLFLLPARPYNDAPVVARVEEGPLFDLLPNVPPESSPAVVQRRPRLTVPARLVASAAKRRLAKDPDSRRRAAEHLGARVVGARDSQRAEGIPCPACGRSSAWFWLAPQRQTRAHCNHQNSCAWSGPLEELLTGLAP